MHRKPVDGHAPLETSLPWARRTWRRNPPEEHTNAVTRRCLPFDPRSRRQGGAGHRRLDRHRRSTGPRLCRAEAARSALHYNQSREAAEKLAAEIGKAGRRGVPHARRFLALGRCRARRRGHGQAFRPARRAGQQCRRHARPRPLCRDDRRAIRPRHGPQCALGHHRLPRRHALAEEAGRLHRQHLVDRRPQRRRRRRRALRLGQVLRLQRDARHGQGTDRLPASGSMPWRPASSPRPSTSAIRPPSR